MMPPHEYVHYVTQGRLAVLRRRLAVRKIVAIIMGHVLILALVVVVCVDAELAAVCLAVAAGAALHLVWCGVVGWRLCRQIRAMKGGRR